MALGPPKVMKTPEAGVRFGLSWSCAVAGRGVFAVSSLCLHPSAINGAARHKGDENRLRGREGESARWQPVFQGSGAPECAWRWCLSQFAPLLQKERPGVAVRRFASAETCGSPFTEPRLQGAECWNALRTCETTN
jgi:hypothetical protein